MFFIKLRASFLRFKSSIPTNLRCSFFGMRIAEDLFFNKMHSFWKQFLKQSNFGWMLLKEFVGTFHFQWNEPTMETIETFDFICDFFSQWKFTFFELKLPYVILLHWVGAITKHGN